MGENQHEPGAFQLYPLGDAAIVLQFGREIAPEIHRKVKAFSAYLESLSLSGIIEHVPAFATLTIYYDPWLLSEGGRHDPYEKMEILIRDVAARVPAKDESSPRKVEVPVCYGGKYGPELEFVARHCKLSTEEVVAIHSGKEYLVYMIGFAPGFPYLGGMDERIATPRKATPRPVVPAGSVGIAGAQTGVYSVETPGGWQLIGRTPLSLFNPQGNPPALLQAGDVVRFVPVSEEEFEEWKEAHES